MDIEQHGQAPPFDTDPVDAHNHGEGEEGNQTHTIVSGDLSSGIARSTDQGDRRAGWRAKRAPRARPGRGARAGPATLAEASVLSSDLSTWFTASLLSHSTTRCAAPGPLDPFLAEGRCGCQKIGTSFLVRPFSVEITLWSAITLPVPPEIAAPFGRAGAAGTPPSSLSGSSSRSSGR